MRRSGLAKKRSGSAGRNSASTIPTLITGPGTGKKPSRAWRNRWHSANGGDSFDWFLLAMAHRQLGNKERAETYFARGLQWLEQNQPKSEELLRLCMEAAGLSGIKQR